MVFTFFFHDDGNDHELDYDITRHVRDQSAVFGGADATLLRPLACRAVPTESRSCDHVRRAM